MPIEIFISYSHEDEAEKNELLRHLSVLRRGGLFDLWSDERVGIGEVWKTEIKGALIRAHVAILLVTKNFLNSDFILENEVPEMLKRHEEGLTIIPIIARDCAWRSVGWLAELQVFNNGLSIWRDGGAHVDTELAEVTYLVDGQTAALATLPEVSPAALPPVYNHILFISTPSVSERNAKIWLSSLLRKQKPAEPETTAAQLYSTINEKLLVPQGNTYAQLFCQLREEGVIVATYGDVATLLAFSIAVLRTVKAANGASLRMGLHCGEIAKSTWNERTRLTREDVYIARRVMELGRAGHLLASQQTADWFSKEDEFTSVFHSSGRRTVAPPDSIEIYNVYKRSTPGDEATDFGNQSRPLAEIRETVIRKLHFPRQLRALREERCSVAFWPGRAYAKIKFDSRDSDDNRVRGLDVFCHKHGEQGCSFEYRFGEQSEDHQPTFKILAEDRAADLSFIIEVSCFNEHDELLTAPIRRRVVLLRRVPRPATLSEAIQVVPWVWDRIMRLSLVFRAAALAILIPSIIVVLYFWAPTFIPKEIRDKVAYNYEFYERRYWCGHDTYQSPPWEDKFLDRNLSHRWAFDEGDAKVVKGEGLDNVDTGAMLVQSGQRMIVAGNLGSLAFYDFSARIRFKFVEGAQAAWVLRAQPDRQTGYVFLLEKQENGLVLRGLRYTELGKSEGLEGGPQGPLPVGTCCFPNDYFDITAEVDGFTVKHKITILNFEDPQAEAARGDVETGPFTVTDFIDRKEMYRCGNAGVLKPPASKMQVETWLVTPYPFPARPVPAGDSR